LKLKATHAALACSICAFLFLTQSSPAGASSAETRPNSAAADAMADFINTPAADRPAVRAGVEALLDFVSEKRGALAASAIAAMRKPAELWAYLASGYKASACDVILDAFAKWDDAAEGQRWDQDRADRLESDRFVIETMPGTAAHRDRDYIARFAERAADEAAALIPKDAPARGILDYNLSAARRVKIELALVPSAKALGLSGGRGGVNLGLTISGSELAATASIKLPYYNALSTATLAPEIAHVIDVLCRLDPRKAPPMPDEGLVGREADKRRNALSSWARSSIEKILPYNQPFGEAFAEYAADRACPLRTAFLGLPEGILAGPGARPSRDVLKGLPPQSDLKAWLFRMAELDSFALFLVERRGPRPFIDFYMSEAHDEARFRQVYGKPYAEAQAEWRSARGL
jgi:hypothetical protein